MPGIEDPSNGKEFLILHAGVVSNEGDARGYWASGESYAELRGDLDGYRDMSIAVSPWLHDTVDVISALASLTAGDIGGVNLEKRGL